MRVGGCLGPLPPFRDKPFSLHPMALNAIAPPSPQTPFLTLHRPQDALSRGRPLTPGSAPCTSSSGICPEWSPVPFSHPCCSLLHHYLDQTSPEDSLRPSPHSAFLETPVAPPYSLPVPIRVGALRHFLLISVLLLASSSLGLCPDTPENAAIPEGSAHVFRWGLSQP